MSINYIEVYKTENGLIAKIHKQIIDKNGNKKMGVCTLNNPNNIKKLLDICHKHNMSFKGKRVLEGNVGPIIKEFDSYYRSAKKRNERLKVIIENIDKLEDKISLVKKEHLGKIVISTALAATLGITAIALANNNKRSEVVPVNYQVQSVVEEVPEYVIDDTVVENIDTNIEEPTLDNVSNDNIVETNNIVATNNIINAEKDYEDGVIIPEEEVIENTELNQMLQTDEFHFSYTDRTDYENITNARRYEDIFITYGNMYGVDPNILMAIAAQENCGKHYEALNNAYATGIMQIERSANLNSTVSAYNVQTGQMDSIYVTQEAIEDLETNIKIGAMIFRNKLEEYNYNIPLALQSYNFGSGNMANSLAMCSDIENIPMDELKSDITNPAWLNYRAYLGVGDSQYIEHIFSFIESDTTITVVDRDGNNISLKLVNDNVNNMQLN